MSRNDQIEISVLSSLKDISAAEWDACANPGLQKGRAIDPFTTHRFLFALENSGSVGEAAGWLPRHLIVRQGGEVIAVMPLYAKTHSQGEYVFDHNWAHAYQRAGGNYYPKLQAAVPFTPATGRRFLTLPGFEQAGQAALIEGAVTFCDQNELSSLHITFCSEAEADAGVQMGLLHRTGQQFHWLNNAYTSFSDFTAHLSSRKRKAIRREREKAAKFGGTIHMLTGDDIQPEHWDAFWHFYQDTGARKWGSPYLSRAFFDCVQETMRQDVLLVLCRREGRWVAGALNFIAQNTLFGRYWGCVEDHPCLHFEVCYYRAIDFAIENNLSRVEAGAQGEHKLSRGYLPAQTHSLHWIRDAGFRDAVSNYLDAEREAVYEEIDILASYGPFRKA